MDIVNKIKKQKEDIYFVVCALGKEYEWSKNVKKEDVDKAKEVYMNSYDKYLDVLVEKGYSEHETFGSNMLEAFPKDVNNEKYFSFVVKLSYMMAYYYELLTEEMEKIRANENNFLFGKTVEDARMQYQQEKSLV